MTAKDELRQKIRDANIAYAAGIPFMTDPEYDVLWQQLYAIDPHDELLYHTAQNRSDLIGLIPHKYIVYGTNKAFNMQDLKPFFTRFGDQKIVIEPKYDGCAAVLTKTEDNWRLVLEGDGTCGQDITHMIPYIECPFQLRHFQAIEILIPWKNWSDDFGANPRNVVAGWLQRKYEKPLINMTAVPHNFGYLQEEYHYSGNLEEFNELLIKLHTEWKKIFPIDGLMLKVADEQTRLIAGNNGTTNNWSIAWKPPIQTKETTVIAIEWNVSRLGRLIPTVIYEPIKLCGTINSRVTGNNAVWLSSNKIQVGSRIIVGKAGEIIPKIVKVIKTKKSSLLQGMKTPTSAHHDPPVNGLHFSGTTLHGKQNVPETGKKAALPEYCPKCGAALELDGVHLICNGNRCVSKLIVSIAYFYSHKGIKIDGLGEALIEKLLANPNCYKVLAEKPWAILEPYTYNIAGEMKNIFGNTIYHNIFNKVMEVNGKKTMAHFIAGLGLKGLAYKSALRLCQYLKTGILTIHVSKQAQQNFSLAVLEFTKAQKELKHFYFTPLPSPAKAIYCITGTLSEPREIIIEKLNSHNYEFSAGVTRETNYLIVGEDPGQVKQNKAKKYNIPCVTEEKFFNLLSKEK